MASGYTSLEDGDRKQDGDLKQDGDRIQDGDLKNVNGLFTVTEIARWRPEPRHWKMATGYTSLEDGDWIQDGSTRHWKMVSSIFSADVVR